MPGARTGLFSRSTPGGVFTIVGIDKTPADVYFVSSVTGTDGVGYGTSPDSPTATLAYALANLVTASKGDVVYVLPYHVESLVAAASIANSKAGVSVIGLGTGRARPVFTWGTLTTATWTISGANISISNCVFVGTGLDAIVTMFAITGDDVSFDGCEFDCAITSFVALLGITITGTDRFRFTNNVVHGRAVANMTNFLQIVGASGKQKDYYIAGNSFTGNYTSGLGAINNITVAMIDVVIRNNVFVNRTAGATKNIVLLTASTGIIAQNAFGQGSGNAPITADACHRMGNATVAAVNTDGSGFI